MSEEDKKLQKQLVDEMMKVYETNPGVMFYMQSLMENYEKLEQENIQLKRDKNIMQNYLQLIKDIGYDYDGYNDVKNLKELIDELCKYALCGIKLDDKKIISSSCEKYYNILGEEILGDKENE